MMKEEGVVEHLDKFCSMYQYQQDLIYTENRSGRNNIFGGCNRPQGPHLEIDDEFVLYFNYIMNFSRSHVSLKRHSGSSRLNSHLARNSETSRDKSVWKLPEIKVYGNVAVLYFGQLGHLNTQPSTYKWAAY
jgi:hypothetical protein